jgi:hypothetical protein
MKSSRALDLVIIVLIISGVFYFAGPAKRAAVPSAPPSAPPSVPTMNALQDAPPFTLPTLNGPDVQFDGKSAKFIVLTAISCPGCQQRVPLDEKAKALVREYKIPIWNHLLYSEKIVAADFVQTAGPTADAFVFDRDGRVSVGQYKGSDDHCWILINHQGKIVRNGSADLKQLEDSLQRYFGSP